MGSLADLLDRVHDEIPAAPTAIALRALSDATREFCSRTQSWRDALPEIALQVGQTSYELSPDTGLRVVALKEVRRNGRKVPPLATELANLAYDERRRSLPDGYFQWQPDAIELVHAPTEPGTLTVQAALTLSVGATPNSLPEFLTADYGEALANGAKMRLVRQASQPWFNPDLVVGYAGLFYTEVTKAKGEVRSGLGEAQQQVAFPSW